MSQATTPTVRTAMVEVQEGFNARTRQTAEGIERLAASVAKDGIVEPLLVEATGNGKVKLIAGHRRLAAAQVAGLEHVPVNYYQGERGRQVSLIENFHREDLDPIDAAHGLKAIADEHGLRTKQEIAEQVDMSVQWVSERLRLLHLPEGVQAHIAAGEVPVEAERVLRKVAEVSARVAECVCLTAKRHKVRPGDFVRSFAELLALTAEGRFDQKPTMIHARRVTVSQVITDSEERKELAERINAVDRYLVSEDPQVHFAEAELDAARAAGCLIEHSVDQGDFHTSVAFITDRELAADLLRRAVERQEAEAERRAEEEAAWRSRSSELQGTPEEQKQTRKEQRDKAKADAAKARKLNEALGRNLLGRRGKQSQKQFGLARAKAIAAIFLDDNPDLSGRGLRLVLPQLQEIEVKQLKSGEPRENVTYADADQCGTYLWNRIEEARSEGEVIELLADAVLAGLLADPAELPASRRIRWWTHAEGRVKKLLALEIKAVKPRLSARKKS